MPHATTARETQIFNTYEHTADQNIPHTDRHTNKAHTSQEIHHNITSLFLLNTLQNDDIFWQLEHVFVRPAGRMTNHWHWTQLSNRLPAEETWNYSFGMRSRPCRGQQWNFWNYYIIFIFNLNLISQLHYFQGCQGVAIWCIRYSECCFLHFARVL